MKISGGGEPGRGRGGRVGYLTSCAESGWSGTKVAEARSEEIGYMGNDLGSPATVRRRDGQAGHMDQVGRRQ